MRKLFLIAGEPSGDLEGSLLIKEIKTLAPNTEFYGLGGHLMQNEGAHIYYDLANEAVVGFVDVIKKIRFFKKVFKETLDKIKEQRPDAVIFIDYPGFNLRMVKKVKKLDIKTIYYISPQIWAWGEKRVEIIKQYVDEMIVFFKFEEEFYKKHGVKAKFTGHPLLDLIKPTLTEKEFIEKYNLKENSKRIFIMPGSRDNEVKKHLPVILRMIETMPERDNHEFLLLSSPYLKKTILKKEIPSLKIISHDNCNAIYHSYAGIVASGTATLESALLNRPFIIIYKTSLLNYLILKPQIKVPYIGIANLILKEKAMPELTQYNYTSSNLAQELCKLLDNPGYYRKLQDKLLKFKNILGEQGAARRAAEYILEVLN